MPFRQLVMIIALLTSSSLVHGASTQLDGLSDWIEAERERWEIPGLAVAIVHQDEVLLARGFGQLGLTDARAVDADTQFGIASLSKAMTATALAMLVDEGRLDWDDRVIDHLPGFALSDPWATGQVTIRDLLSHRVGVGRLFGNRLTFMPGVTREDAIERLRHHEFEQGFREGYVYSNAMYAVAGAVLESVSGQSWEDFIEQHLFGPLGMRRSNARLDALDDNAAWPHQEIRGELVEIQRRDWRWGAPAAAVNSTMHDLVRWMRFNLGEPGKINGQALVSKDVMQALHGPANLVGFDSDFPGVNAYGLGWGLGRYQQFHVLRHGGATDGINTLIWLLPELQLGVVVSANRFTGFNTALAREVVDRVADRTPTDWSTELLAEHAEERVEAAEARQEVDQARVEGTVPRHPPAAYAGQYQHPLYGQADVRVEGQEIRLVLWQDESQVLTLEHWHQDTFRGHWKNPAQREKFLWFAMGADGQPAELHVRFTLRPLMLEEGTYPADYTRTVRFVRHGDQH